MPIDPNIALRYQPIQMPSETNALAKLQQLQAGQQAQQLNALKMNAVQQEMQNATIDRAMKDYSSAISRAPNKEAAGKIVRQMFQDPVVGQHWQRFGTVDDAVNDIPSDAKGFSRWQMMFGGATPLQAETLDIERQGLDVRNRELQARQAQQAADFYDKTGQMPPGYGVGDMGAGGATLGGPRLIGAGGAGNVLTAPVGDMGAGGKLPTPAPIPDTAPTAGEGMPGVRTNAPDVSLLSPKAKRDVAEKEAVLDYKERQTMEKEKPAVKRALDADVANIDKTIGVIDELMNEDSGLSDISGGITGAFSKEHPALRGMMNSKAAAAQAKLDQLKAQSFLSTLGSLKQMSKTGASGLGSVSNAEGQRLVDAFAALSQLQDPKQMRAELAKAKQQLVNAKQRVTTAYTDTYGGNVGAAGTGSSMTTRPALEDIFK